MPFLDPPSTKTVLGKETVHPKEEYEICGGKENCIHGGGKCSGEETTSTVSMVQSLRGKPSKQEEAMVAYKFSHVIDIKVDLYAG